MIQKLVVVLFFAIASIAVIVNAEDLPESGYVRISNPADYAKLLKNELDIDSDDKVVIDWQAHPNILSQPKILADYYYPRIFFEDGPIPYKNNVIGLQPGNKWLNAFFFTGSNFTYGLPENYEAYNLYYAENATCTEADLDVAMTWKNSRNTMVTETSGIAGVYFSQHGSQFKDFEYMKDMAFLAYPHNYKEVKVAPILENARESWIKLSVHVDDLNDEQVAEFASQQIPDGWRSVVRRDENKVARVVAWVPAN